MHLLALKPAGTAGSTGYESQTIHNEGRTIHNRQRLGILKYQNHRRISTPREQAIHANHSGGEDHDRFVTTIEEKPSIFVRRRLRGNLLTINQGTMRRVVTLKRTTLGIILALLPFATGCYNTVSLSKLDSVHDESIIIWTKQRQHVHLRTWKSDEHNDVTGVGFICLASSSRYEHPLADTTTFSGTVKSEDIVQIKSEKSHFHTGSVIIGGLIVVWSALLVAAGVAFSLGR